MKVMMDSQRSLLISKINQDFESKGKSLGEKIDFALETAKKVNNKTTDKLDEIIKKDNKLNELQDSLLEQVDTFNKIKENSDKIISDAKVEIKEDSKSLISEYKSKLESMDNKLNNSLSLATKIMEGLVNATKEKLNNYYEQRIEDFLKNQKIDLPDISSETTKELSLFKTQTQKSISDLNKRLSDLGKIKSTKTENSDIEELIVFKEQYAKLVTKLMKEVKELKNKK